ncbi:MAG: S-layer homology domain-containing protein [Tissierellia bacterium]|nr:S-layer homology domain-containing protein [Tissierellia bacterium]
MKKQLKFFPIILVFALLLSGLSVFQPISGNPISYAQETNDDPYKIVDQVTGAELINYHFWVDWDYPLLFQWMDDDYNIRDDAWPEIKKKANEDFEFKVEKLDPNSPIMQEFFQYHKDQMHVEKENGKDVYTYFGYKIYANRKHEYTKNKKEGDGAFLRMKMKEPLWEHSTSVLYKPLEERRQGAEIQEITVNDASYGKVEDETLIKVGPAFFERDKNDVNMILVGATEGYYFFSIDTIEPLPKDMAPGEYTLPVIPRLHGGPGLYSMGAGAVVRENIKLKVDEDGNKTLYPEFRRMYFLGTYGHLLNLCYTKYYNDPGIWGGVGTYEAKKTGETYIEPISGEEYPKSFIMPLLGNDAGERQIIVDVDAMRNPDIEGTNNTQSMGYTLNVMGNMVGIQGEANKDASGKVYRGYQQPLTLVNTNFPDGTYESGVANNESNVKPFNAWQQITTKDEAAHERGKSIYIPSKATRLDDDYTAWEITDPIPKYTYTVKDGIADLHIKLNPQYNFGASSYYGKTLKNDSFFVLDKYLDNPNYNKDTNTYSYKDRNNKWDLTIEFKDIKKITFNNPQDSYKEGGKPVYTDGATVSQEAIIHNVPINELVKGSTMHNPVDGITVIYGEDMGKDFDFIETPLLFVKPPNVYSTRKIQSTDELAEKIKEAKAIDLSTKTEESAKELMDVIEKLEALGPDSSQDTIRQGLQDLHNAIVGLKDKKIVDKTNLKEVIDQSETIDLKNKTPESVKPFQEALSVAKTIYGNEKATEEQVEKAVTDLQTAIANLKDKDGTTPVPSKEKTYLVPVSVWKHPDGKQKSMADGAINPMAKVVVDEEGRAHYTLKFKPIVFSGIDGQLTNLFINSEKPTLSNPKPPRVEAQKVSIDEDPYNTAYSFTRPEANEKELSVSVWVDAMDEIAGGNPGDGEQNALLKFDWDKATLEDSNTPNPDTPSPDQPKPPVTPGVPTGADKGQLFREIQDSLNLAYNEYTRESWNAFNQALTTAVVLNQQPYATQKEVDEAATMLRAKRQSLVKESTSQPGSPSAPITPSNPGNTNQPITPGTETTSNVNTYEVPVEVLKAYDSGYSMANNAVNHTATVIEQNGKYTYYVQFVPMEKEFGGKMFVGNLTKLFVYQPNKTVASSYANNVWAFTRNQKDSKVKVAVWVDAMDEIAGGTPGAGEQDAILSFDWSRAKVVSKGKAEAPNFSPAPTVEPKVEEKKPVVEPKITPAVQPTSTFTDVVNHWAKTAIEYVVEKGYFKGTSASTFTPNRGITRGEFVTVLGRIAKVDTGEYAGAKFKDVKSDMFYAPYVNWAESLGVVKGTGYNAFEPNRTLTREEMAVIMSRYLKTFNVNLKEKENTTFKDKGNISPWAKDAVSEMAKKGVVKGMDDGTFSPKTDFTRAQVAQVLYNIDHK